ncbi:MAG: helix-turn-helix transcriptional regulator [Bacteroidia bacterium]|nr:helix-turn-helix transcriptional regulator [Bacteroidia bacterium]
MGSSITKEFRVKGMICSRCLKVLNSELSAIGAEVLQIELGKFVIKYNPRLVKKSHILKVVLENEFELIYDETKVLAESTKQCVIRYVWDSDHRVKLSQYLVRRLNYKYSYLSGIFTKTYNLSIERYFILLKIERIKELIENGQLSFSEVAYKVGYQNLSALSRQFKIETGMTMKEYKNLGRSLRTPIDKI